MTQVRLPTRWIVGASLLGAVLISLTVASQIFLSMIDHGHDYWRLAAWQLGTWSFWALAAPWVLGMGARLVEPKARTRAWPLRLLVAMAALGAAHIAITAGLLFALQPYVPVAAYDYGQSLGRSFEDWWRLDPLIFAGLLVLGYGFGGYQRAQQAELRRSRLEAELSKAQLAALQLQIRPHFLMNSLNTIAALVRRRDNERALAMVVGLGELLDRTLHSAAEPTLPLAEEIAFVRAYAALQQQRFPDRLAVDFDVEAGCEGAAVPAFLLQPLVENAIRHGVGRRAAGGRVWVRAARHGERLELVVEDDGVGFAAGFAPGDQTGIGMANVHGRLVQHHGEAASLEATNRPAGGARVVVRLPFEPASEGAEQPRASTPPLVTSTDTAEASGLAGSPRWSHS